MSVGAQPETAGPPAASAAGGERATGPADPAGRLLGRLSVLPALLVMSWLLAGFPLLLIGHLTPVLTLALAVPIAALISGIITASLLAATWKLSPRRE